MDSICFPVKAMAELYCELHAALLWRETRPEPATLDAVLREAALLLTAINQMEATHEAEPAAAEQRRLERLEAKLDLALHLLARALQPATPAGERALRLSPEDAAWDDDAPPAAGTALMLELCPSSALPLTLRLPALAVQAEAGRARARFVDLPEALREALYQFVFRRHRQAIRARGATPP